MSRAVIIEWEGKSLTLKEWSELTGISLYMLRQRNSQGILPPKLFEKECQLSCTICWDCKNAVPTADGKYGCPWSREAKPVDGWEAKPTQHKDHYPRGFRVVNSFNVRKCPKFIHDEARKAN